MSTGDFCAALSSDAPAPGGGSTSALCAALAAALGAMAGNVTARTADETRRARLGELDERARGLRKELLGAMDADAVAYAAVAAVMKMDKNAPERPLLREEKLAAAASVPLRILELGAETAALLEEYASLSSRALISDVATGAALLEGAIRGAAVNVRVNTASMKDREAAERLDRRTEALLTATLPGLRELFERLYRTL